MKRRPFLVDGKFRQTFMGDIPLAKAKERALAVLSRQLEGFKSTLEPINSAKKNLTTRETNAIKTAMDAVIKIADARWDQSHHPDLRRLFLESARRELEASINAVVELTEVYSSAEQDLYAARKRFDDENAEWYASCGHSPTQSIITSQWVEDLRIGYRKQIYVGPRVFSNVKEVRNPQYRPGPSGEYLTMPSEMHNQAKNSLDTFLRIIADKSQKEATQKHAAIVAVGEIFAANQQAQKARLITEQQAARSTEHKDTKNNELDGSPGIR
jgi:hypothetical protein